MYSIVFPKRVTQYRNGINSILAQFHKIIKVEEEKIKNSGPSELWDQETVNLDFSKTTFLAGELTSFISTIVVLLQNLDIKVTIQDMNPIIKDILDRNGFRKIAGLSESNIDNRNTVIPLFIGYSQDENIISKYLDEKVFHFIQWPEHLKDKNNEIEKINSAIFEITRNINEHSGSNTVHMCGQYYPKLEQLRFTIVDSGNTIPKNLKEHIPSLSDLSDTQLIDWATELGHSTKGIPASGAGLFDIKNNLSGEGEFIIVSNMGFWMQNEIEVLHEKLFSPFPGTMIHLNFFLSKNSNKPKFRDMMNDDEEIINFY